MSTHDGSSGHTPDPSSLSKIRHTPQRFGPAGAPREATPAERSAAAPDEAPVPIAGGQSTGMAPKIRAFDRERRHEDTWSRTPNSTGSGAIHVRTFHSKLTEDALHFMDQSINEWLDAHPQYEVKFVSSTVGVLTGKLKEPALICQVWV